MTGTPMIIATLIKLINTVISVLLLETQKIMLAYASLRLVKT